MHLQFKCASCAKNQKNEKNTRNIAREMENTPNFKSWLLVLYQGCTKNLGPKIQKKKVCREPWLRLSAKKNILPRA
jgi:hypothetical protein